MKCPRLHSKIAAFFMFTSSQQILRLAAVDWKALTQNHNRMFLNESASVAYPDLSGRNGIFSLADITSYQSLIESKGLLDVPGSWYNFRVVMNRLFYDTEYKISTLRVLFVGGSVCSGVGCLSVSRDTLNVSDITYDSETAWCSWPRRFITFFRSILSELKGQSVNVSYRVCCSGGASTNNGIDSLKGRDYSTDHCGNAIDYTFPGGAVNKSWEPDIVFWDYAVNDGSNQFFVTTHPRIVVYETFVSRTIHLTSKPQLISLDFLHGYMEIFNEHARKERTKINKKYCIPMINYLSLFCKRDIKGLCSEEDPRIVLEEFTPWHAAGFRNNHPQWPTHVIWAKLITLLLMAHMPATLLVKVEELLGEPVIDGEKVPTEEQEVVDMRGEKCSAKVMPDNFCPIQYTTRYDFTAGGSTNSSTAHLIDRQAGDIPEPLLIHGSWSLRSDKPSHSDRTGWVYESSAGVPPVAQHRGTIKPSGVQTKIGTLTFPAPSTSPSNMSLFNSSQCYRKAEDNILVFRCHRPERGDVKVGYLASYGDQWGVIQVNISRQYMMDDYDGMEEVEVATFREQGRRLRRSEHKHIQFDDSARRMLTKATTANDSLIRDEPFFINAKWDLLYSVLQEHQTLAPPTTATAALTGSPRQLEYVDVSVSMCMGRKFKLESISCC